MNHSRQRGLTLPELIITVIVLSILAGLAVPAFSDFLKNERIVAEANELLASFHLARTEAIKRNRRVTICKTADPQAGVPACDTSPDAFWPGYLVFTEENPNAAYEPPGEVLIKVGGPLDRMTLRPGDAASFDNYVSYVPRGLLRATPGDGGNPQSGELWLCDDRGSARMRAIVLDTLGRPRILAEEGAEDRGGECPP